MVPYDGDDRIREVDSHQHVGTHARVQLHLLEFGNAQLPRLVQDVFGDDKFAHVVEQGSGFDGLE